MDSNQLIGIGLRAPHVQELLTNKPAIGWLEVHSENYFHKGGNSIDKLQQISQHYPISLHGVGLSLGSADGVSSQHLQELKQLIDKVNPFLVSEHLSWGKVGDTFMPDLLPIPYTQEALKIFTQNINRTQAYINRPILIENASSYIEYANSSYKEVDFLVTLCRQTGAKILLDINNIYVSSCNHNWNSQSYIESIPKDLVQEIHLAGHTIKQLSDNKQLRIDTHDNQVCEEVWQLYKQAIDRFGPTPTLLEWDANIPSLEFLIKEASKAKQYIDNNISYVRT